MSKLRIVSEGDARKTYVWFYPDEGLPVDLSVVVEYVAWELDASDGRARAVLRVAPTEVDVEGLVDEVTQEMVEVTTIGARVRRWIRGER